jgi:hypothetical protein
MSLGFDKLELCTSSTLELELALGRLRFLGLGLELRASLVEALTGGGVGTRWAFSMRSRMKGL